MKPFNLKKAKAGKSVCTRDGSNARVIHFSANNLDFPIVALITDNQGCELPYSFTKDGRFTLREKEHYLDLMMLGETVNINGHEVPKPETKAPKLMDTYFAADVLNGKLFRELQWENRDIEKAWLDKNLIHLNKRSAIKHAKALLSFLENKSD